MRYLGASAAVLVAAMTLSLTALGQTPRATEGKPAAGSLIGANTILPSGTLTFNIDRYGGAAKKPTLLQAWVEYFLPPRCEEIGEGSWTKPVTKDCGKIKCGKVTFAPVKGKLANGDCPNTTFTFAGIFYIWNAHNNQSTLPGPPGKVNDMFEATWMPPDKDVSPEDFTFNIHVPVVRPEGEETVFREWNFPQPTALFDVTLKPPQSDKDFSFEGEKVKEEGGGSDNCASNPKNTQLPPASLQGSNGKPGMWPVEVGNMYGPDGIGSSDCAALYYRCIKATPCGYTLKQQMTIKSPADKSYVPYGKPPNTLKVEIEGKTTFTGSDGDITSSRAGVDATPKDFTTTFNACKNVISPITHKPVVLPKC